MVEKHQPVNMFWHGPKLGDVHVACIRSFLRHGHPVILHCYDPPEDLPACVKLFDARRIMPISDLIAHEKTGSVALGTNRYRYRLLRAGHGLYADCDMYCLRPIPPHEYIFGFQDTERVNGAILKYPSKSALAEELVTLTDSEFMIPPTLNFHRRVRRQVRSAFGRPASVRTLRWGVWGPELLSHSIKRLELVDYAAPRERYYPLRFQDAHKLYEVGLRLEDLYTPQTYAVHLWHKAHREAPPSPGTPLHQILSM